MSSKLLLLSKDSVEELSTINRHVPERDFSSLENGLLGDSDLSYEASGILTDHIRHSGHWIFTQKRTFALRKGKTKMAAIKRAYKELEACGYIQAIIVSKGKSGIIKLWRFYSYRIPLEERTNMTGWDSDRGRSRAIFQPPHFSRVEKPCVIQRISTITKNIDNVTTKCDYQEYDLDFYGIM